MGLSGTRGRSVSTAAALKAAPTKGLTTMPIRENSPRPARATSLGMMVT